MDLIARWVLDPLQRYIDKNIKRPSKMLLFGELKDGGTVKIDVADSSIILIPVKEEIALLQKHNTTSPFITSIL